LTAWIIIRLAARLIRQTVWSNLVFFLVWGIVALNLLGLLDPLMTSLDSLAFNLGQLRISALTVIKGMAALAVFLWAASLASRFLSERIRHIEDLTPTLKVLLSKLLSFVLATIAVVAALGIAGVNLTAFAVLGGALGIGIGLGLQNAAANIMGGVMLLLDKSIKPGDVIAVGETFGWVTSMGGRYVSIRTRDGIEHLIPNEVFITRGIENWSFSDRVVRLKLPIGISYKSDLHRAIALCLEAAAETPRVVKEPASVCLLKGFGDSAVELELRIWIRDPEGGVSNVKSEVLLGVWDKFHAHGIEIPFPQRDLHIKPPAEFKLVHDGRSSHTDGALG
jgi:small-conductance mechanosensitive channel